MRLEKAGYLPVFEGQTLGMISFNNYIDPDKAAAWIFENMLEDELSSEKTEVRKIFNPDLRQAGAAMAGGTFRFDSFAANAYVVACNFATPVEVWELELINLINQFRDDPWAVLNYHGIQIDKDNFPELETLLTYGLDPLAFDLSLYVAADVLASDMLENGHLTPKTSDGKSLEDRAGQAGYTNWSWLGESRGRFSTCNEIISPEQSVERIFRNLLSRAFSQDPESRNYPMLAPWAQDCGIRVKAGQSPLFGGICGDKLHILVADFGSHIKAPVSTDDTFGKKEGDQEQIIDVQKPGCLVGLIFQDENLNNLYDHKEGLSGLEIIVDKGKDSAVSYETVTNPAGGFFMDLPQGQYRVKINSPKDEGLSKNMIFKCIDINSDSSTWLPVSIDATATE
jgi:hypothetical protein